MNETNIALRYVANVCDKQTVPYNQLVTESMVSYMIDVRHPHSEIEMPQQELSLKIGAVSYLNSKPLIEGLPEASDSTELMLDVPSRLADDLAAGLLDVALIPSVESFLDPDYTIVSDACVATHGPVLSVKLYSRVHPGDIKTMALDEGSRTSAALAQILLAERYGVRPQLETLPLRATTQESTADAVLLIGDRAMKNPAEKFYETWDLGEEWVNWTGLPFVFAMWIARENTPLGNVPDTLSSARDLGLANVESIATAGAKALDLPNEMTLNYLTKNLHFRMGSAELAGLNLFRQLARENGLATPHAVPNRRNGSVSLKELATA